MKEIEDEFDQVIDRRNTNCLKYDFAIERGKPDQVQPLWVADMDFQAPKEVLTAIRSRVEHGIFGYSEVKDSYFQAIKDWMWDRHHWKVEPEWLVKTPGVVFALAMAVKAFTNVGDHVLIQQPVYYPFSEVIRDNQRVIVENTLILGNDGRYTIDFVDFEQKIIDYDVKLFLMCSPHNPVGRVWTKEELIRLGWICYEHHVIVVSDEIHEDFVFDGHTHHVFADLKPEFQNMTITCTAPSKTFNLAGLQVSNILIPDQGLREQMQKQIAAAGYSQLNAIGLTACEAAYKYGGPWQRRLLSYLKDNLDYVRQFLNSNLPDIRLIEPEGTYLLWLDFRRLGLTEEQREQLLLHKAGLWLDSGAVFGKAGDGFERINIACPRSQLAIAMEKLKAAIQL